MRKSVFRCVCFVLMSMFVFTMCACGSPEPEDTTASATAQTTPGEVDTSATLAETTGATEETTTESEVDSSRFVVGTVETVETELTTTEPVYNGPVNYLTGEALAEGLIENFRPTAVSFNNLRVATKFQSGLSNADIVYEVEVEGGITRLLAFFSDASKAGNIGSVRSARPVMVSIVLGHDAYFTHAGGSTQAINEISTYGVSDIDAGGRYAGYFFYDEAVVNATSLEHGYFTTGEKLSAATASFVARGGRGEVKDGHNEMFNFYVKPTVPEGGTPCTKIITSYGEYKPSFIYSEETGKYAREQYGSAHVDYATGEQLLFDNVIVLSVTSYTKNEAAGYRYFNDVGTGSGILATKGSYINIRWDKESYTSPLKLTTEDGTPISVNTGKTFVSYVNGESNISVTAE